MAAMCIVAPGTAKGSDCGCQVQDSTSFPLPAGMFRSSMVFQSARLWQGWLIADSMLM